MKGSDQSPVKQTKKENIKIEKNNIIGTIYFLAGTHKTMEYPAVPYYDQLHTSGGIHRLGFLSDNQDFLPLLVSIMKSHHIFRVLFALG